MKLKPARDCERDEQNLEYQVVVAIRTKLSAKYKN